MFTQIFDKEESDKINRGDIRTLTNVIKEKLEMSKNRLITEREDPRFIAGIAYVLSLISSDLDK